jgi:hypothetical protein
MRKFILAFLAFGILGALAGIGTAEAVPCKPPQSAAMLTGPVYSSIQAECNWIDALNRRDAKTAARILGSSFSQIDADGAPQTRAALLANVASGRFGTITLTGIEVPFSSGSTNIVVSTWTFRQRKHRVTDVFFCDLSHACSYQLIAEQITGVVP